MRGPAAFVFFGAYDPAYPRNAVIRRGLRANGAAVSDCAASTHWRFWLRYPMLALRFFQGRGGRRAAEAGMPRRHIFVPEFCAKDVPLAKWIGLLTARRVVFDPLAARYETKILDWRRKPPSSLTAWWNFRIDAAAFRFADVILADTAAHRDYFCRTYGLKPQKVRVLYLGFDDHIFRSAVPVSLPAAPPSSARPFRVLFFGSFLPLHGVEIAAEAAKLLAKETGIRFRLIGSGQTFPAVRRFVEQNHLDNVELVGRRPLCPLPIEIAAADVCLGVFGRTEKSRRVIPHKVVQSMAMGRPVITARSPAIEELFAHRRDIFLCDEPLAPSLALAILELRRDGALRESIAAAGACLVRERLAPASVGRSLLDILGGPGRSGVGA
jgi:glycosyltransferase involved in cell wall biosynthesis